MTNLHSLARRFFDKVILERPGLVIICLVVVVSFLGYKAKDFRLDASAETLVLLWNKRLFIGDLCPQGRLVLR
jgi:predicted RND superfamily exporter protein